MAKATIAVQVNVDEKTVPVQVLAATPNKRLLVVATSLVGALVDFVGAPAWKLRELASALAGHVVTRSLFLVKSGTRFRVTEGNAEGINLAEEALLAYKSFSNFGEFVQRCLDGELTMGTTPIVSGSPEVKGSVAVALTFSAGTYSSGTGQISVTGDSGTFPVGSGSSPSISDFETALGNFGTVTTDDPGSGTGTVTFTVALSVSTATIAVVDETPATLDTFNRTGYSAAVPASGGEPANAILLDQVTNELKFVRVSSIPTGTDLADVVRDEAESTSYFE